MCGLLPEGERPRELAALHHSLVPAPRVVDDDVENWRSLRHARKGGGGLFVVGVIAAKAGNPGRQIPWRDRLDRPAGREYAVTGVVQRRGDALTDATARTSYESDRHSKRRTIIVSAI
jgi:hypothetical protein